MELRDGKWQCVVCGWTYKHKTPKPPRRNCPESKRIEGADAELAQFKRKPCHKRR